MATFKSMQGVITQIDEFGTNVHSLSGCAKIYSISDRQGAVMKFVVSPSTYVVNQSVLSIGDNVIAFYDINTPTSRIYPPQYQAVAIAVITGNTNVIIDTFNRNLVNSSNTLQINIGPQTRIMLTNGQPYMGNLTNRSILVVYGFATKSIPARTTPSQIIVLCYE
ncbi:MAG: hypothetical protein RRX92_06155 [Lachnospiraceae bacterium]